MISKRLLRFTVFCLVVALTVSVAQSVDEVLDFLRGENSPGQVFATANLVWVIGTAALLNRGARAHFRAQRDLHRREQQLAADACTTNDWVWETDLQGRFIYCNAAVEDLLGYTPETLLGRSTLDLVYDDRSREMVKYFLTNFAAFPEEAGPSELQWRHCDGHAVVLEGSFFVIRDEDGRPISGRGRRRRPTKSGLRRSAAEAHKRVTALLTDRGLEIALQPIIDVNSGRMVGAEALARFPDGRSPELWFQDAEHAGLTKELDVHAFKTALKLFDALPDGCYLSVNAGPHVINDFALRARLLRSATPFHRLVIEITEHAHVADYDALNTAMQPLRQQGVRFAVDDTGAGYASLNHVLQIRPDIIKLDRTLIAGLSADKARRSLVTALVLLGLDVGATVTGEGVETAEQLDSLATLGVDHAQGYLIAKPTTDRAAWDRWRTSLGGTTALKAHRRNTEV